MKKLTFAILIFLSAVCLAVAVSCSDSTGVIIPVEISYAVEGGSTKIIWSCEDGCTLDLYSSPSKEGEFKVVAKGIKGKEFFDDRLGYYYKAVLKSARGEVIKRFDAFGQPDDFFADTVSVLSPSDSAEYVNALIEKTYQDNFTGEFTDLRRAFLLHEGEYSSKINFKQVYYTTVAGLGQTPENTKVKYLENKNGANGNALINFWRGAENFTVTGDVTYAVSQGTSLRRMNILGNLTVHDSGGYASGGYVGNSFVMKKLTSGSQQQWLTKNSRIGAWSGNVWNMVFSGTINAPSENYPSLKYTTVERSAVSYEKPFLTFNENGYCIFVPEKRENARGYDWNEEGTLIPWQDIYFARADRDNATTINRALKEGKHLFLNPGVYMLDEPVCVTYDDTVVLGCGLATLIPTAGNECIKALADNVSIAGILFDAGKITSQSLLSFGLDEGFTSNPRVFDCYFRVGGRIEDNVAVKTALSIKANGAYVDNVWLWRADHGDGVGWDKNQGDVGMEVFGDNCVAYGLFAEHFKKNNVVWQGKNGYLLFYQSEIAYDVPSNAEWADGNREGYSSLKICGDGFVGQGLGVYTNFYRDITLQSVIEVAGATNVTIRHACTITINKGRTLHVVNDADGVNGFLTEFIA